MATVPLLQPISTPKKPEYTPSNEWFRRMDELNHVLRARGDERDAEYEGHPVKIAVLVSGITPPTALKLPVLVRKYMAYVDDDRSMVRDTTGHGSLVVNSITKVFSCPELYIARVSDMPKLIARVRLSPA